jgi:serine/threonine-protein kinase
MPGATTMTLDIPLPEQVPPPIPTAAPARRRHATLVPGIRIGVWRIEHELGRGGMATVYAVVHTRFDKRAALKLAHGAILGPQFTPETFLREARIANRIDHAGVPDVFATGSYAGRPYLAMERLHGRALGVRLDDGALPREAALDVLIELCDVLAAAHAAGVIHGDLKVDNVFLLDQPGAGGRRVKLLDWGIARVAGEDDPLRGMIAGTLTYVPPEQIRGDAITPASDVYSLGVLAYRLLLGEPPFTATGDLELLHKHLHAEPPRPRTRWSTISAELEATLVAMLAKQPQARPALGDVARVLRAARRQLRSSALGWLVSSSELPGDVMGRPVLAILPPRAQNVIAGVAIAALVVATLLSLFSA